MADDLIRRKDAIDAMLECCSSVCDNEYECGYDDGLRKGMHKLKHLPSAQPEPRWIPVTERLPKVDNNISKRVLVTTSCGVVKEAYYFVDHWSIDDVDYKFSVAAWMPLPKPWRGEENEHDQ